LAFIVTGGKPEAQSIRSPEGCPVVISDPQRSDRPVGYPVTLADMLGLETVPAQRDQEIDPLNPPIRVSISVKELLQRENRQLPAGPDADPLQEAGAETLTASCHRHARPTTSALAAFGSVAAGAALLG
jgi:hypothetical protein